MQMESQAAKGVDFRGRFLWRLALLFLFGYINGLVYMGEFFMVYAVLGVFLIPLYKVPTRWLLVLCVLLFLQIPAVISFVSLLSDNVANEPTAAAAYMDRLFERAGRCLYQWIIDGCTEFQYVRRTVGQMPVGIQ